MKKNKTSIYVLNLPLNILIEIQKKQRPIRKESHEILANYIISLANKPPSMLLDIIDRKLRYYYLRLIKVNTHKVKVLFK